MIEIFKQPIPESIQLKTVICPTLSVQSFSPNTIWPYMLPESSLLAHLWAWAVHLI